MRYLPKFSDDYDAAADDLTASAIASNDLNELIDACEDDWPLVDADDLELLKITSH